MLAKTNTSRLEKVCKVLFPKYRRVALNRVSGMVTLYTRKTWLIRSFFPKWKLSYTELIGVQIPRQLADFKYGNASFISVIQEDLVKCELTDKNKIDYFFEAIAEIKCEDIYKQLKVGPSSINTYVIQPVSEEELLDEMIEIPVYSNTVIKKSPLRKSYWVSAETMFYFCLVLLVAYEIMIHIKV